MVIKLERQLLTLLSFFIPVLVSIILTFFLYGLVSILEFFQGLSNLIGWLLILPGPVLPALLAYPISRTFRLTHPFPPLVVFLVSLILNVVGISILIYFMLGMGTQARI